MFTLTMRFTLPEDTDWSRIPALMEDRARSLYCNMPGLISKAFVTTSRRTSTGATTSGSVANRSMRSSNPKSWLGRETNSASLLTECTESLRTSIAVGSLSPP